MKTHLSIDLGAGSGRVIAARHDGAKLTMEVVSRVDNTPVELAGHLVWNLPQLLQDIRAGLRAAAAKYGQIASVGVDTWGVDYGLLDKSGRLLGLPYIYRDGRNTTVNTEAVFDLVGKRALYDTKKANHCRPQVLLPRHPSGDPFNRTKHRNEEK